MRTRAVCCLALIVALVLACVPAMYAGGPPSSDGVSLIPINPDAAAALKAQGRNFKYPFPNNVNQGRKFNPGGSTIGALTTDAQQEVIVLFVSFSDNPPGGPSTRADLQDFDNLLFGTEYKPAYWEYLKNTYGINYPTDRTLYNYYQAVSYGKVSISTANPPSQTGWINAGHSYNYYFGDHANGFNGGVWQLVVDALTIAKANGTIDFSTYAGADHVVPNVFIVVAGTGAEWSGTPDLMWSHSSSISWLTGGQGFDVSNDGNPVYVNHYAMMPEVGGDLTGFTGSTYGPYPATVGVYAHEYGHVLGLPDQYDYGYQSEGTGQYSLMAGGSWGLYPRYLDFYGNSPAQLDAWSKFRLGFVVPQKLTTAQTLTLRPVESFPDIYRVDVPNSGGKEYYLLENRQPIGFDASLWRSTGSAHGLAIYHIDDVVLTQSYWRPNENETWKENRFGGYKHYGISLIQADDQWGLEHGYNQGDSGDLYPGYFHVTAFGNYTFPNSTAYYFWGGSSPAFGYSGVNVFNIVEGAGSITADFSFLAWAPGNGK